MESIKLTTDYVFEGNVSDLIKDFDEIVQSHPGEFKFSNTEAALSWIVRGGLDYFDKLDSDFLGKGNASGIPSMETDHFANNFYRLSNTLDYLCELWKIKLDKPKEWQLLSDIRTFIIHSGERVDRIESLTLKDYKDAQLGRIFKKDEDTFSRYNVEKEFDYRIQIWTDKQDKSKNRLENEVDYDNRMENFRDVDIYLRAEDVRNIILLQVKSFTVAMKRKPIENKLRKELPSALKDRVVNELDFDKLESLIKNKSRGGYFIENGEAIWDGFGLKRLYQYASGRFFIANDIRDAIKQIISDRAEEFWNAYNDETIDDYAIPSLDVFKVFGKYMLEFEQKGYVESKSLHIAPAFNKKEGVSSPDIDYLLRFISAVNVALGVELDLENDVNGVVCDYFVKSVEMKLREEAEINGR